MFKNKIKLVTTGILLLVASNTNATEMYKKDFECVKEGKNVSCTFERFTRTGLTKVKSGEQWASYLQSTFKATTDDGRTKEKFVTFQNKEETITFDF